MEDLALVLAGGGVAGIAWELGFLLGVQDESEHVARALLDSTHLVGTSAGATVAAQISSGVGLSDLFHTQLAAETTEIDPGVDLEQLMAVFAEGLGDEDAPPRERLRRIGAAALRATTVSEETRRAVIESRLPSHEWPERALSITAIDASTGELVVFQQGHGVSLVDAVAASCAVPGIWPTVTIDGRKFMDGGVESTANAFLAGVCGRVVVLAPATEPGPYLLGGSLLIEITSMTGSDVLPVFADAAAVGAFGTNPLAPSTRAPAALAGRDQGRRAAAQLGEFLGVVP
ncbi:patatin-like phospholipase family protein [Rhodococcus sp. NPDC019627]|uniref:patatin-like phospholipase family protein n=1 Tax=unclassified Rhodococcus (in: high G+C Gram-positive bacteria) TaxID=192944 RepID=UPI0033C018DD